MDPVTRTCSSFVGRWEFSIGKDGYRRNAVPVAFGLTKIICGLKLWRISYRFKFGNSRVQKEVLELKNSALTEIAL